MKKKVIAVLLASMMATSMVPVTAMAEDQPLIESTEDAQTWLKKRRQRERQRTFLQKKMKQKKPMQKKQRIWSRAEVPWRFLRKRQILSDSATEPQFFLMKKEL